MAVSFGGNGLPIKEEILDPGYSDAVIGVSINAEGRDCQAKNGILGEENSHGNDSEGESTEAYEESDETGSALMNVACTLCNKMFTYADDIQQHFLMEHSGVKEETENYAFPDKSSSRKRTSNRTLRVKLSSTAAKGPIAKRSKRLSSKERIDYGDQSQRIMGTESVAAKRKRTCPRKRRSEAKKEDSQSLELVTPKIERIDTIEQIPVPQLKIKGTSKEYRCGECDAVFNTRWLLDKHKYDDHDILRPYRCEECPRSFLKRHHLKEHEATHARKELLQAIPSHPEEDGFYHCRYCEETFENVSQFKDHQETQHKNVGAYPCDECGKVLSASSSLRRHKALVHEVGSKMFSCTECDASFTKKWALDKHSFDDHGRPRPFQCPECPRAFFRKQHLTEHQITHVRKDMMLNNTSDLPSKDGLFHCRFCVEVFKDSVAHREHELTHTGFGAFPCSICNKVMHTERSKRRHERLTHNIDGNVFKCEMCEVEFTTEWMLTKHLCDDHGRPRPYQCPECPRDFLKKGHLHEHIITHVRKDLDTTPPPEIDALLHQNASNSKQDGDHQCRFCAESFESMKECREHEYVHSGLGRFPCRICGKVLVTEKAMKRHERESHMQNVNCRECGLELASNFWLSKHLTESHGHPHPYWCSQCGQGFFRKRILLRHEKVHTDATAHHQKCPECELVLPSDYLLKKHLCDDHGHERPFHCVHCGRGFIKRGHLIDHENRHVLQNTGQHPLMCSQCGKGFVKASRLKEHEKLQHGIITDFKCPICNKDFFNVAVMKAHVIEVHHFDFEQGQIDLKGDSAEPETNTNTTKIDKNETDAVIGSDEKDVNDGNQSEIGDLNEMGTKAANHVSKNEEDDNDSIVVRKWMQEAHIQVVTCKMCDHNCKTPKNLRDHMVRRHGEWPYFCSHCGKRFYQKFLLVAHERRHTGVKPFTCFTCQETFFDRQTLRNHKKKACFDATFDTVFECWECGESFNSNSELKHHARSHLPFRCKGCDAPYKTKRSLREHCKVKHQAKLSEVGYYRINVPKPEPEIKAEDNNSDGESNLTCEKSSKQDWSVQNRGGKATKIVLLKNKLDEQKGSELITENKEDSGQFSNGNTICQTTSSDPSGPMNFESVSKLKDVVKNVTKSKSRQSRKNKKNSSSPRRKTESKASEFIHTSIMEPPEKHLGTISSLKNPADRSENVADLCDHRTDSNMSKTRCVGEGEGTTHRACAAELMYQCNHCTFQTTVLSSVHSHLVKEHQTYDDDYTEMATHYNDEGEAVMRVNSTSRAPDVRKMMTPENTQLYTSLQELPRLQQCPTQNNSDNIGTGDELASSHLLLRISPKSTSSTPVSPQLSPGEIVVSHPMPTTSLPPEIPPYFPMPFPANQHQAMLDRHFVEGVPPSSYHPIVSNERYTLPTVYTRHPTYLPHHNPEWTPQHFSNSQPEYYKPSVRPDKVARRTDRDSDSDSEVNNMLGFSALS